MPYTVQCHGKSLHPGKYSVTLAANGRTGKATLKQQGQVTEVVGIVHQITQKRATGALLVDHSGKTRSLSVLQVADLDLILDPKLQATDKNIRAGMEKLPLVGTAH